MSAVRRVRLIVVTGVTVLLAALSIGGSGQLAPAYANGLPVASADVSPAAASTTTVESVIADDGRVVLLLGEAPSSMTSAMGFPMYQYATSGRRRRYLERLAADLTAPSAPRATLKAACMAQWPSTA